MKTVNVHEAKTHLSKLLNQVSSGEEIIIAKSGTPVARLVPVRKKPAKRISGTAKGKVILENAFFEPLPEDLLEAFER